MTILVIAEHNHRELVASTRNAVGAAKRLEGDVHVLVAGQGCLEAARQAAEIHGVSKVLVADAAHLLAMSPENIAPLIARIATRYSHVLAAATAFGRNVMPRAAALLDVAQISDIVAIEGSDTFVRPIYAGNALATVRSVDPIKVVTVRTTAFPAGDTGNCAAIEQIDPGEDIGLSRLIGREIAKSDRPDLLAARVIVSGGRGLGSAENYRSLLEPLADKLGAALGASRAAVDAGFVPNAYQVGQTGKIVAPELYLAIGISGAIQHLAGMKDSSVIVAINKDADAPILESADYGLVADLFHAVPEMTALL